MGGLDSVNTFETQLSKPISVLPAQFLRKVRTYHKNSILSCAGPTRNRITFYIRRRFLRYTFHLNRRGREMSSKSTHVSARDEPLLYPTVLWRKKKNVAIYKWKAGLLTNGRGSVFRCAINIKIGHGGTLLERVAGKRGGKGAKK